MYRNNIYYSGVNSIPQVSLTNKCIVIDLDQTLVATQEDIADLKRLAIFADPELSGLRERIYYLSIDEVDKPGSGSTYEFWGVVRPHVEQFLLFCFSYFRVVAVWSAGQKLYVEAIVEFLFRNLPAPHVVFTADDIVRQPPNNAPLKPLMKMFASNPVLARYMNLDNTWALDDNPSTFEANPKNGLLIPPYNAGIVPHSSGWSKKEQLRTFYQDDPALLQLRAWLEQPEVARADDVRKLDTSKIFITPLSEYPSSPGYNFVGSAPLPSSAMG